MTCTLSWIASESETLASGGDVVDMAFETLIFDGTASEQYGSEAIATEHPIEDGAAVTDHVRPGLRNVTLDVLVSAHPTGESFVDPSEEARSTLSRLCAEGIEVSVDTAVGSWDSMLLVRIDEQRSGDRGDGYRATLTLREIRRVATSEVEAPAPRVERGRRTTDRGDQTGPSVPATPTPPAAPFRPSALRELRRVTSFFGWE